MSDSDEAALKKNFDKVLAAIKVKLIDAAGPNPRTKKADLAALIDTKLDQLSRDLAKAAGPNPRT